MARRRGYVRGLKVGLDRVEVWHVQFADDMVLILQNNSQSIFRVLILIQVFNAISGLKINLG